MAKMQLGRQLQPVIATVILGNEINYYHFCEYNLKHIIGKRRQF